MAPEKPPPERRAPTDKELAPGPIVFVIGPPASGKGTLCNHLHQQIPNNFRHMSVGDSLREFCKTPPWPESEAEASQGGNGLPSRDEVAKYLKEGKLLPPDAIIPFIKQILLEGQSLSSPVWLIDGFPRNIETARAFEKEIKAPFRLIVLHCSPPFARERFVKRQRSSTDDHGLFDKRLKQYEEELPAILDHYRDIITNVHTNGTKDESWGNLVEAVRAFPEFEGLRMFE